MRVQAEMEWSKVRDDEVKFSSRRWRGVALIIRAWSGSSVQEKEFGIEWCL
jgi:hypothetical protein